MLQITIAAGESSPVVKLSGECDVSLSWPPERGHGLRLVRNAADRVSIAAGTGGARVRAAFAVGDLLGRATGGG
jgi:hypothetical protein